VKQQIVCSRSFGGRISEYEDMRQAVCAYAERAAEKLRDEKQYCRQVAVFLRTSPHAVDETFYGNQAGGKLQTPSNDTRDIIRLAMASLDRIWIDGHSYMKAGVMLGDFYSLGVAQLNLFDECKSQANSEALMRVIDGLNKSGKGKLWFAGQGIQKSWAMKRDMLSPAYTTRLSDLPVAKWRFCIRIWKRYFRAVRSASATVSSVFWIKPACRATATGCWSAWRGCATGRAWC